LSRQAALKETQSKAVRKTKILPS